MVALVLLGPLFAPHSPSAFVGLPFAPPSGHVLLGTDFLGRDVLSRVLWGGRSILELSLAAAGLGLALGTAIGLIAAYSQGLLDSLLMRGMDVILAFPAIVFALLAVATVGPKLWLLVIAVGLSHTPRVARLVRGASLDVVNRDFVYAVQAMGEPTRKILLGEILPNIAGPLLVETSLRITFSISLVAALSFLGFGLQPPAADWGLMINENQTGLTIQPWAVVAPILCIALLTIGTSLIADGLARALAGIDRAAES
ncbi:MAG TPA: ABC transporter permease [Solirubrobacteraceae bacterium]|jgi:peptide/nickel transport system permease protein|nr:ABC transporter permease [Solirubrobacteraceae bacterium]